MICEICIAAISGFVGGCISAAIWMYFETRKAIANTKKIEAATQQLREEFSELYDDVEMSRLS